MEKLGFDHADPPCKAASISKASQTLTQLAPKVSQWGSMLTPTRAAPNSVRLLPG
jgi:hypothetical protein